MSKSLNEAAMGGNLEEVAMRLNLGEDVNQTFFPRYTTPLHDAVTCGRVEVVKLLIQRGADVNAKDYKGSTPLRLAKRYGQDSIAEMLEALGARDESTPPSRKTSAAASGVDDVDPPWVMRKPSRQEGASLNISVN